jgi:PAS domain S-box-containing protein
MDEVRTEQRPELLKFFEDSLPESHPLISFSTETRPLFDAAARGIQMTAAGPMMISCRPILTSSNLGPVRGYMVLAAFMDHKMLERLSRQTHVMFSLSPISKGQEQVDVSDGNTLRVDGRSYVIDEGKNISVLKIYNRLKDIEGHDTLLLEGRIDRKVMEKGCSTMQYAVASFLIAGGVALVVMMLLIQGVVLKPIGKLTASIVAGKRDADGPQGTFSNRRDEIGVLYREFKNLMAQLKNRSRCLEELNTTLRGDIEKRKKAEAALRESEERFKTLLENLPGAVFVHDLEEKILLVNDIACDITGYSRDELLSKKLDDINPGTATGKERARMWQKVGDGKSLVVEAQNTRKDGSIYPVEVHLTRIRLEGNPIVLALVFDITSRKKAEEALRASEEKLARSRKMESLGLLAGGVAHDLNNVLSGIVAYPELILMDLPEGSKLVDPIKTMQTSGKRAVAIVQDLLTVARGVAVEKQAMNLNPIVDHYLESAEHKKLLHYHEEVVVRTELDKQLLNIKGAPVHIGKSLMNLVSNAAEAMEDGGEIVIQTRNCYLDQPIRGYEEVNEGEYTVLTVKDTGPGIAPKDLERIFEPFYTKKMMGRSGTGLGLAIVWNVMQEHLGYVDVVSGGTGTTFKLYFPITREEIQRNETSISITDYTGNGEKILVVDDVESQRKIFCNMLEILGYRPTAVPDGEAAIEYLKENTVDLLILDMIMDPGINGRETYERILKIRPGQKAVIASGFAETEDVRKAQRLGAGKYIKKPVQLEKIGLAVKAELSKG